MIGQFASDVITCGAAAAASMARPPNSMIASGRSSSRPELIGVRSPDRVGEGRREADPREIWQQEDRGEPMHATEGDDRGDDEREQEDDVGKRERAAPPCEEEPAPRRVADELRNEERQRASGARPAGRAPNEPG